MHVLRRVVKLLKANLVRGWSGEWWARLGSKRNREAATGAKRFRLECVIHARNIWFRKVTDKPHISRNRRA